LDNDERTENRHEDMRCRAMPRHSEDEQEDRHAEHEREMARGRVGPNERTLSVSRSVVRTKTATGPTFLDTHWRLNSGHGRSRSPETAAQTQSKRRERRSWRAGRCVGAGATGGAASHTKKKCDCDDRGQVATAACAGQAESCIHRQARATAAFAQDASCGTHGSAVGTGFACEGDGAGHAGAARTIAQPIAYARHATASAHGTPYEWSHATRGCARASVA
jgi:hypothetical protein